jgi:DNA modification methylase
MDPFMGGGSTAIAAVKEGRRFVGIEIEPQWFDLTCNRLKDAAEQPDLFIQIEERGIEIQGAFEFSELKDAAE